MQRLKNILAFLIAAVVFSPVVSNAASLTIDGASRNFLCGTGTRTCALPDGQYGRFDVDGAFNSFQSSDGPNTDTLKLTAFKITPRDPNFVGSVIIAYSQFYSSGGTASTGRYTFGDYMGGYFLNTPTTTKAIGDQITMNGSGETPNVVVRLPTLSATVSTTNFFQEPKVGQNTATGLCSGGVEIFFCNETLRQTVTIGFIGRDTVNVTGSFFMGASNDGSLPALIDAERIADIASFPGDPPEVPEPTTILLLGTGLAGIFVLGRKRLLART